MIDLYTQDGKKAGLYDICKFWIQTYPSDVFITEPKDIVKIRDCCDRILHKINQVKE